MGLGGDDETRRIILARRARFLAAALASVSAAGMAAGAEACGGTVDEQHADGGEPKPCLGITADAQPQPCLSRIPDDAASDAGSDASLDADAEPQPCLAPPPGDGG